MLHHLHNFLWADGAVFLRLVIGAPSSSPAGTSTWKTLGFPSCIMIGTGSMMRSLDELLQMLARHSLDARKHAIGTKWLRMSVCGIHPTINLISV